MLLVILILLPFLVAIIAFTFGVFKLMKALWINAFANEKQIENQIFKEQKKTAEYAAFENELQSILGQEATSPSSEPPNE